MNRRFSFLLLLACALAAAAGYFCGSRTVSPADTVSPVISTSESRGLSAGPLAPEERQELRFKLTHRILDSPGRMQDFPMLAEVAAILGTLAADDLRALAGDLASGRRSKRLEEADAALLKAIYRAWSRLDPAAAATGFAENRRTHYYRSIAFEDWRRRDPGAVEAWLATAPCDPAYDACRVWDLTCRAAADPEHLIPGLGILGNDAREKLLIDWSLKFGDNPQSWPTLETLIAREGNPDFAFVCYQRMTSMVGRAPLGDYLALLERAQIRERDRPALAGMICNSAVLIAACDGFKPEDRAIVEEIYQAWHRGFPREAEAWKSQLASVQPAQAPE